jgi:hypothetical protein
MRKGGAELEEGCPLSPTASNHTDKFFGGIRPKCSNATQRKREE